MNSNKLASITRAAAKDSFAFLENKDFSLCDKSIRELLAERPPGYLYALSQQLSISSNYHGRIAFGALVGGNEYDVNLVDCWNARCLAAILREQEWLCRSRESSITKEIIETHSVRLLPQQIYSLAFDFWKLYAVDCNSHIEEVTSLFELFDLRQDVTFSGRPPKDLEPYDLSVCISLIVGRGDPNMDRIIRLLSPIPVFDGIEFFWDNDAEFRRFTERAAQWHFDYSIENKDKFRLFAITPADILVPSWILALDKFRQSRFGRASCLGSHELLDLSSRLISLAKIQVSPPLQVFSAAEAHYSARFGDTTFDPVALWERILEA